MSTNTYFTVEEKPLKIRILCFLSKEDEKKIESELNKSDGAYFLKLIKKLDNTSLTFDTKSGVIRNDISYANFISLTRLATGKLGGFTITQQISHTEDLIDEWREKLKKEHKPENIKDKKEECYRWEDGKTRFNPVENKLFGLL